MPSVSLHPSRLPADADGVASGELRIRNNSRTTKTFRPEVTGAAADWASFFPPSVAVGPGQTGVVRLNMRVRPSPSTPVGVVDFAVVIHGDASAKRTLSVNGSIDVAARAVVVTTVGPITNPSPSTSMQMLHIENRGNGAGRMAVSAAGSGVLVDVSPEQAELAPGEEVAVAVRARAARRTWRDSRELPFQIDVDGTGAAPRRINGAVARRPLLTRRAGWAATAGLAVLLTAVVLRTTVLAPAPETKRVIAKACPTAGHEPSLRNAISFPPGPLNKPATAYTYYSLEPGSCVAPRFNPCEPLRYVLNSDAAPAGGVADAKAALAIVSAATGLSFVEVGSTDEKFSAVRSPYQPERYGNEWAPLLIGWYRQGGSDNRVILGQSRPYVSQGVYVSGFIGLNVDAYTEAETRSPLKSGFGPVPGAVRGQPIGARGVTWGRVLLHELVHLVGLAHVADRSQLMVSELSLHTNPRAELGAGDVAGLRTLGRAAGCLPTPPAGSPGRYPAPPPPFL